MTNEGKLRALYTNRDETGVAFCVSPTGTPIYELPHSDFTLSDRPVDEWVGPIVDLYARQVAHTQAVGDDSVPVAKLMTGTHIYAAAFGSPVKTFQDNNPCALPFLTTADEADRTTVPDISASPTLARVIELGHKVQRELGPDAYLSPCDMQTGFDTACLIWDKTALYCAMMDGDDREAVKRLADKCAMLFKNFLTALRREFPNMSPLHCPGTWCPPELGPWMSNDECGAVNTTMFDQFLLPEMIDLAETFGGIGMHCCAAAEHQFASFNKIPNLYGLNRVQATQGYFPILDHFAGPGSPTHVLAWIDDETIAALLEQAPAGTRFIVQNTLDDVDEAKAWLDKMRSLPPI